MILLTHFESRKCDPPIVEYHFRGASNISDYATLS